MNVGCVPKKLFVYGSHYHEDFADAAAYGWDVEPKGFHWPRLRDNKNQEIWRGLGFVVRLLADFHPFARNLGAAHCIAKCLARIIHEGRSEEPSGHLWQGFASISSGV